MNYWQSIKLNDMSVDKLIEQRNNYIERTQTLNRLNTPTIIVENSIKDIMTIERILEKRGIIKKKDRIFKKNYKEKLNI